MRLEIDLCELPRLEATAKKIATGLDLIFTKAIHRLPPSCQSLIAAGSGPSSESPVSRAESYPAAKVGTKLSCELVSYESTELKLFRKIGRIRKATLGNLTKV